MTIGIIRMLTAAAVAGAFTVACAPLPPSPTAAWSECEDRPGIVGDVHWECATLTVPLDYGEPQGAQIQLALIRARTAEPAKRLGSLLYNPGGPGGSGLDTVSAAVSRYRSVLERYDLVSWDPRGVGRSTPVRCPESSLPERMPRTDEEWAALAAAAAQFADTCHRETGDLLEHVGLFDSANDIERIRALLGDERLGFLGVSYGGQLGAAYVSLFPQRAGRIVLDAPGSPFRSYRSSLLDQAAGSERALQDFLAFCGTTGDCALGNTESHALERLDRFLADLDRSPLPTDRGYAVDRPGAVTALSVAVAAPETWHQLNAALAQALSGNGTQLAGFADLFTGRRPDGSSSNFSAANTAANCADYPDSYNVAEIRAFIPEFTAASPHFGELTALRLLECAHWPVHGVGRGVIEGRSAEPVLLIGNTGDPQAPYSWVSELADRLDSGVLLTYNGVGHGAYGGVDRCVDAVVDRYLLEHAVPPANTKCP
ncbi:alpha/beta hydrolase [Nocardia wallacei]|uniref:alpha/beta hydrolase n=2 Tax=Nocardia wallacei TaxID=480035 RepID=UPI00165745EF|nr:alpha/beta hydrolase [Nocardia wallacei]